MVNMTYNSKISFNHFTRPLLDDGIRYNGLEAHEFKTRSPYLVINWKEALDPLPPSSIYHHTHRKYSTDTYSNDSWKTLGSAVICPRPYKGTEVNIRHIVI